MVYNKGAIFKYREAHKEEIKAYNTVYMAQYYMTNKQAFKDHYDDNKENIKDYAKLNYAKTKDDKIFKMKQKKIFKNTWGGLWDICL